MGIARNSIEDLKKRTSCVKGADTWEWCPTERNQDCTTKKWAYCKK